MASPIVSSETPGKRERLLRSNTDRSIHSASVSPVPTVPSSPLASQTPKQATSDTLQLPPTGHHHRQGSGHSIDSTKSNTSTGSKRSHDSHTSSHKSKRSHRHPHGHPHHDHDHDHDHDDEDAEDFPNSKVSGNPPSVDRHRHNHPHSPPGVSPTPIIKEVRPPILDPRHLRFAGSPYHFAPVWPYQPSLEAIKSLAIRYLPSSYFSSTRTSASSLEVEPFEQSPYHKAYSISYPNAPKTYIFRVNIPVFPYYKTSSEVATLKFLKHKTSVKVPSVVAYDEYERNELGYEWIMFEKIEGVSLKSVWRTMSFEAKIKLVKELAGMMADLRAIKFKEAGSIHFKPVERERGTHDVLEDAMGNLAIEPKSKREREKGWVIGKMISEFWFDDAIKMHVHGNSGPFKSTEEWMCEKVNTQKAWIKTSVKMFKARQSNHDAYDPDSDYEDESEEMLHVCDGFLRMIPKLCKEGAKWDGGNVLVNDDISDTNIIVDPESFAIKGIMDWEMACVVPMWKAKTYPYFLWDIEPFEEVIPPTPTLEEYTKADEQRLKGMESDSESECGSDTSDTESDSDDSFIPLSDIKGKGPERTGNGVGVHDDDDDDDDLEPAIPMVHKKCARKFMAAQLNDEHSASDSDYEPPSEDDSESSEESDDENSESEEEGSDDEGYHSQQRQDPSIAKVRARDRWDLKLLREEYDKELKGKLVAMGKKIIEESEHDMEIIRKLRELGRATSALNDNWEAAGEFLEELKMGKECKFFFQKEYKSGANKLTLNHLQIIRTRRRTRWTA